MTFARTICQVSIAVALLLATVLLAGCSSPESRDLTDAPSAQITQPPVAQPVVPEPTLSPAKVQAAVENADLAEGISVKKVELKPDEVNVTLWTTRKMKSREQIESVTSPVCQTALNAAMKNGYKAKDMRISVTLTGPHAPSPSGEEMETLWGLSTYYGLNDEIIFETGKEADW